MIMKPVILRKLTFLCLFSLAGCLGQNENDLGSESPSTPEVPPEPSTPAQPMDEEGTTSTGMDKALPLGSVDFLVAANCGSATTAPTTQCLEATISGCPDIADIDVRIKVSEPSSGDIVGTVILGSGGSGAGFYELDQTQAAERIITPLINRGFRVIQRAYRSPANWSSVPNSDGSFAAFPGWAGGPGGALRLACRYATLIDGIYKTYHTDGPFCVSGNSGGANEISYALAHYGMGRILDLAVLSSGPPMGRIDYGCLGLTDPTWAALCPTLHVVESEGSCSYKSGGIQAINTTYTTTSCGTSKDPSLVATWLNDSVLSLSAVLHYPQTQLRFIYGDLDATEALPLGRLYANAVISDKTITVVAGAPHTIANSTAGADQVFNDLSKDCILRHE